MLMSLQLVKLDVKLRFQLILDIQVYGGSVSLFIGTYVFAFSATTGMPTTNAGVSLASELSVVLRNCRFNDSSALTSSGGLIASRSLHAGQHHEILA
jgi:hypothetical protein